MAGHRAVFLDRDGTVTLDKGLSEQFPEFGFERGAVKGLEMLTDMEMFKLVIVTNQGSIGKGRQTIAAYEQFTRRLIDKCAAFGIRFDDILYCPHHPDAVDPTYRTVCPCRKPAPGMLFSAGKKLGIDLARSYMIGDRWRDVMAGVNAGCQPILLTGVGARGCDTVEKIERVHLATDLADAAAFIAARELSY